MGTPTGMGIGTSIFLIALGAILAFAVNASISGLELSTIGFILMVCGALGLIISMFMTERFTRRGHVAETGPVVRERDIY